MGLAYRDISRYEATGVTVQGRRSREMFTTLGVSFTRNIFAEFGYRYIYLDHDSEPLHQINSFDLFSG